MSSRGSFRGRGRGGGSNTRFTGKKSSFRGSSSYKGNKTRGDSGIDRPAPKRDDDGTAQQERFEEVRNWDEIDERMGFWRFESGKVGGEGRVGWLVNMHQVSDGSERCSVISQNEGVSISERGCRWRWSRARSGAAKRYR
jgi:DNA polymerase epsilon subunit 1